MADHPPTVMQVFRWVAAGIITPERAAEIMEPYVLKKKEMWVFSKPVQVTLVLTVLLSCIRLVIVLVREGWCK